MDRISGIFLRHRIGRYVFAVFGVAFVTCFLLPLRGQINSTTIGFTILLFVLSVAIVCGSGPALVASVLGALCFNFFFLLPYYSFTIADPQNWVALIAFFVTALAVGQLSARAKRRAEEAEAGKIENRRLYDELQEAFDRASEAEALRRSDRLKSALLDAVTHDLRTPLTSIKASATLLLDESESGEQSEKFSPPELKSILRVISEEVDRLDRFVESIVDLARIESGDMRYHRNWGTVEEIIEAAVVRAEPLMQQHELRMEVANELPVIHVDRRAVAEVVYTLIDNATKYAPTDTCIIVKAEQIDDEMIQIVVEDSGPGVPSKFRERVFDKFFQVNGDGATAHGRADGIGMGLSIAKGIVEAHGGRIWIGAGAENKGARVTFTVPIGGDGGGSRKAPSAAMQDDDIDRERQ